MLTDDDNPYRSPSLECSSDYHFPAGLSFAAGWLRQSFSFVIGSVVGSIVGYAALGTRPVIAVWVSVAVVCICWLVRWIWKLDEGIEAAAMEVLKKTKGGGSDGC